MTTKTKCFTDVKHEGAELYHMCQVTIRQLMSGMEKAMASHSSVLAWRIPGTRAPGGLPSMGSQSRTRLKWLRRRRNVRLTKFFLRATYHAVAVTGCLSAICLHILTRFGFWHFNTIGGQVDQQSFLHNTYCREFTTIYLVIHYPLLHGSSKYEPGPLLW